MTEYKEIASDAAQRTDMRIVHIQVMAPKRLNWFWKALFKVLPYRVYGSVVDVPMADNGVCPKTSHIHMMTSDMVMLNEQHIALTGELLYKDDDNE